MKKVYCKNCKYRTGFGSGKILKMVFEAPYGEFRKIYCNPYINNEKNGCPHYKRKWYKFWVK